MAELWSAVLTLNLDSYLLISSDSFVRIKQTNLDAMHFDIERGEVFVFARSFKRGASLVIHTPSELLTVSRRGRYRFRVAENGETEANVERGELRYTDEQGNLAKVKKGKQINFVKGEKNL